MNAPRKLSYRIFGEAPAKGAPRVEVLRWVRGFYLKPLPLTIAVYAMVVLWVPGTFALVFVTVTGAIWLLGLTSLSLQIRREQRREIERMPP